MSDHRFSANQFRLLLHHPSGVPAAYWLLDTLRRWLGGAGPAMQLDTLRRRLLKVGGRVWQHAAHVRLRLATSHPGQDPWLRLATARRRRE